MAKRYWNMGIVRLFNDVIYEEALSRTPNGLRYHLIDICVHELAKVNKEASVSLTEATFLDCLEPFFAMVQRVEDKNVQKRVVDSVMMKFLNEYSFVSDVALSEDEEEDKQLIFQQVHVGTVAKFIFEIASDGDTDERYRKGLYEMHKTFVRKIRAAGRDVDTDAGEEEEVDKEEEMVTLTDNSHCDSHAEQPIVEEETTSTSKKDKKKKKKRKAKEAAESSDPEPKADEYEPAPTTPTTTNETAITESSNKSKKKKRKKTEKNEAKAEAIDITSTATSEKPPLPTSTKKKKKQKTDKPISKGDVLAHKTDLSPNSSDGEGPGTTSVSKRVSFGARNQSKSHKASMKAIKSLKPEVWSTANRTPDKSILLKRPETEVKKSKSQKKKRKST